MLQPAEVAAALMPPEATALEVVFAGAGGDRLAAVPVPIALLNDATKAPPQFLSALAYEVGVDFWNEAWPDVKKRAVIQAQIPLKARLGTLGAIRAYVGIAGGRLVDSLTPPVATYAGRVLSDADYTAWLGKLPQLRITFGAEQGKAAPGTAFAGKFYAGRGYARRDDGRDLLGRHAYLYDPATGASTKLTTGDLATSSTTRSETASLQGSRGPRDLYCGGFIGQFVADPTRNAPRIVTWTITTTTTVPAAPDAIALTLGTSLTPVSTRTERVPILGTALPGTAFAGHFFAGRAYARPDKTEIAFYDRLYLADPSVAAPVTRGTSFAGHCFLGQRPFTARLLVNAMEHGRAGAAYASRFFAGRAYAKREDPTKRDAIMDAICLAQAGRDRILVDFQCTRALTLGDGAPLDGSHTLADRLARRKI